MGSGQRFQVLGSLRRGKSTAQKQERKPDGKENKAQHILGLSEAALDTARAQSISSSNTAGVPALSLSDATTEFGSSTASTERPETTPELKLKASSVLLHEEFCNNAETGNLAFSRRLTPHGSSSTLNSHYDAQTLPSSISQQTSESSRRDFALRKGSPHVINSTTPNKDSQRQTRLLKKPKKASKTEENKPSKLSLRSPDSPARSIFGNQRSTAFSEVGWKSTPALSTQVSLSKDERQHENPPRSSHAMTSTTNSPHKPTTSAKRIKSQADTSHIKVNVRRPKVGVKHWFDGFECDSSEDEAIDEPELDESFVTGMEAAFENGKIGLLSKASDADETYTPKGLNGDSERDLPKVSRPASKKPMLAPDAIPPRVSTLNAKSSKSTLSQPNPQHLSTTSTKAKANSLAANDLHHTSVLDLSSSDDDEPDQPEAETSQETLPQLRDSIAVESLIDSDIVIGTAKTVDTKQNASIQATPSLKRVRHNHPRTAPRPSIERPHERGPHDRATYLSDQSSETTPEEADLLTSFPPTPTDMPSSARTSILGSRFSDNLSIESTRLVSVTKHEESLLTAMRLRKALNQVNGSRIDPRMQALRGSGKDPTKQTRQPQESCVVPKEAMHPRTRSPDMRGHIYADVVSDGSSITTFQTNRSIEQSTRFSFASFRSDSSVALEDSLFLKVSPNLLATANGTSRLSRATFLSTSTDNSREASRTRREKNYRRTLEKLSSVPDRDDISSQDFIDWPYHGWEARTALTAAH